MRAICNLNRDTSRTMKFRFKINCQMLKRRTNFNVMMQIGNDSLATLIEGKGRKHMCHMLIDRPNPMRSVYNQKESAGLIDYLRIVGRRKPEHSNKQQPHAI